MSRIEEALRRAAGGPAHTETTLAPRDRFTLATKPQVRIDDYAAEPEAPPVEEVLRVLPRVVPEPARSAPPSIVARELPPTTEIAEGKLVSLRNTDQRSVEQYRRMGTTLHNLQRQHGIKVLMVTSSVPREGKTLTSANLALTLSESYGRRVLLIDGDLRRPFVHELFGVQNNSGLREALRTPGTLPIVTVTPHLSVLPAGRAGSDSLAGLASDRMRTILKESSDRFDWIIVDTPPVGLLADAKLLSALVDGVIFVIGAGTTNYQLVEWSVSELVRERIIGTVLNRAEQGAVPSDYYDHYYDDSPSAHMWRTMMWPNRFL